MRELAVLGVNAAALLPGFAVLRLIGMRVRTGWTIGLAYLAGVAVVVLAQTVLLPAGVTLTPVVPVVLTAALWIAALARGRYGKATSRELHRSGDSSPARSARTSLGAILAAALLGVLGVVLLIRLADVRVSPLFGFDVWSQWTPKAELLAHHGLSAGTLWGAHQYAFVNPDYPIALPVFEADQIRIAGVGYGSADLSLVDIGPWLLLAAWVAAVVCLSRARLRLIVVVPLLLCFAAAPSVQQQAVDALADVPLALFISLGALLLVRWLDSREGSTLALGALFLAVGANLKDEGTAAALLVISLALVVVAVQRDWRSFARGLLALLLMIAAVAPWRIWCSAHHIRGVISLHDALDPGYLAAHAGRAGTALDAALSALAHPAGYLLLPAAAIAVILTELLRHRQRNPAPAQGELHSDRWRAPFHLALLCGYVAIVVWAQWASPLPLNDYLPEATRFMTTAAGLAAVAVIDLFPTLVAGAPFGLQLKGSRS